MACEAERPLLLQIQIKSGLKKKQLTTGKETVRRVNKTYTSISFRLHVCQRIFRNTMKTG